MVTHTLRCAMSEVATICRAKGAKCLARAKRADSAAECDGLIVAALWWMELADQADAIQANYTSIPITSGRATCANSGN
jgi:hypothetical protein